MTDKTRIQGILSELTGCAAIQQELNNLMAGQDWVSRASVYADGRTLSDEDGSPLDYRMAAIDELVAELNPCSFHWVWWKQPTQAIQLDNSLLELVDILHFILSEELRYNDPYEMDGSVLSPLVEEIVNEQSEDFRTSTVGIVATYATEGAYTSLHTSTNSGYNAEAYRSAFMRLLNNLSEDGTPIDFEVYWDLVKSLGFTPEQVISKYTCKAGLNLHRTRNGYKQGTYKKIWKVPLADGTQADVEDNEVLLEYVADYRKNNNDAYPSFEELIRFLDNTYRTFA